MANPSGPSRGHIHRRTFLQAGAAASLTAAAYRRVHGANERIGVGVIGFGLIGRIHTRNFHAQSDVDLVALADVYGPRREAAKALVGERLVCTGDFRELLDRRDIDAVVVATPDHWHALQTMHGLCRGQGRVRREAADPVCPRGPVDDRRGAAFQAGRATGHPATLRRPTIKRPGS